MMLKRGNIYIPQLFYNHLKLLTFICVFVRYKKVDSNTNRFKECITMKTLTTMTSECINIKLHKWNKINIESDGR